STGGCRRRRCIAALDRDDPAPAADSHRRRGQIHRRPRLRRDRRRDRHARQRRDRLAASAAREMMARLAVVIAVFLLTPLVAGAGELTLSSPVGGYYRVGKYTPVEL